MVTDAGMDDKFAKVFTSAVVENGEWAKKIDSIIASRTAMLSLLRVALDAAKQNRASGTPMEVIADGSPQGDHVTLRVHKRYATFYHAQPHTVAMSRGGAPVVDEVTVLALPADATEIEKWCDDRITEALVWIAKGA
jgi:hypothetical protein